jgi:cytochrome P450 family 4
MLALELLFATAVCSIIYFVIKRRKFLELAAKIPGPSEHIPLIGILPEFIGADLKKIFDIVQKYQSRIECPGKIWFGPELMVIISTPEAMQKVLNSKECLDKPNFFKCFRLQQASLFGTLEAWKSHRKVLNPAFSIQVLKTFVPLFDKNSKKLLNVLDSRCKNGEFDIFPFMSAFFLETILNAALDLDVDIQCNEKKDEYLKHYDE